MQKIRVEIQNRDWAEAELLQNNLDSSAGNTIKFPVWHIKAYGCLSFLNKIAELKEFLKNNTVENFKLNDDQEHSNLLLKKLVLSMQSKYQLPYLEDEICHCRHIKTNTCENSALAGNLSLKSIGATCSAGITCGSCKPDLESLIDYIKNNHATK